MTRHKRRRVSTKSMYQWHRYIGVSAALLVILLAITGLMLNHTSELALDKSYVTSPALLHHYGIDPPRASSSFAAGPHWISQWDKQLYLDTAPLGKFSEALTGAVLLQDMLVISLNNSLLIYTRDGELIEKMGAAQGIPTGILAIGTSAENRLLLKSANGMHVADEALLDWQSVAAAAANWSQPSPLPATLNDDLARLARNGRLSVERVVLDLHSGRILGNAGVWIMDTAAILLLFLALSGSWLWLMRLIRNRHRHKKH